MQFFFTEFVEAVAPKEWQAWQAKRARLRGSVVARRATQVRPKKPPTKGWKERKNQRHRPPVLSYCYDHPGRTVLSYCSQEVENALLVAPKRVLGRHHEPGCCSAQQGPCSQGVRSPILARDCEGKGSQGHDNPVIAKNFFNRSHGPAQAADVERPGLRGTLPGIHRIWLRHSAQWRLKGELCLAALQPYHGQKLSHPHARAVSPRACLRHRAQNGVEDHTHRIGRTASRSWCEVAEQLRALQPCLARTLSPLGTCKVFLRNGTLENPLPQRVRERACFLLCSANHSHDAENDSQRPWRLRPACAPHTQATALIYSHANAAKSRMTRKCSRTNPSEKTSRTNL